MTTNWRVSVTLNDDPDAGTLTVTHTADDDATADDAAAQVIAAMIQAQPALDGRLEAEAIQAPGPLT